MPSACYLQHLALLVREYACKGTGIKGRESFNIIQDTLINTCPLQGLWYYKAAWGWCPKDTGE